jgi:hypothetical protein
MPNDLELSIFRTLAYFAYFKYPLTSFEIWKWLLMPAGKYSLFEVITALDHSVWLRAHCEPWQGFYALHETQYQVSDRHLRFLDAMRKYRKVERAMQILGRLPWIEGVAVCNSLAWYATTIQSDIDLFIIAAPRRVWSTRLLTTLPLLLLRQRPGECERDPLCLSFFSTESAFDFSRLKIAQHDPYLAYWSKTLVPILDRTHWSTTFHQINSWLSADLPNAWPVRRAWRFSLRTPWRWPWLPLSEQLPKQVQLERFPVEIQHLMNVDTRVVVNDAMLKFHDQDTRAQIQASLEEKLASL